MVKVKRRVAQDQTLTKSEIFESLKVLDESISKVSSALDGLEQRLSLVLSYGHSGEGETPHRDNEAIDCRSPLLVIIHNHIESVNSLQDQLSRITSRLQI